MTQKKLTNSTIHMVLVLSKKNSFKRSNTIYTNEIYLWYTKIKSD